MSAMPPVDNYITYVIEKPWQTLDITMVEVYHVQMRKWIVMIFLCDIYWARGMLTSLRNHRPSQRLNGKKWRIVGGRCWEKNRLSWSLNRLQLSLYQQAGGTRSKYNYWSVVAIVNTGAVVIRGKYRSSEVNKSIVISIIDRDVYRWVTTKRFSQHDQKRRPIRSVASDCLTKIYERSH